MYTYLWCFFIYAFLGWCGEVVYAAILEKRFVNRGFLNGPLCPIYGLGVVMIHLFMRPFGYSFPILMVGSMVLGSGLEWIAGYLLEKLFHQKWWDYSDHPHNLNGYICLKFSLLWSVAGTVAVTFIVPFTHRLTDAIPRKIGWVILLAFLVIALADFFVTIVSIVGLNRKLRNLEYVSNKLKAGSDRLGEKLYTAASSAEAARETVGERLSAAAGTAAEKRKELENDWRAEAERLKKKYEESLAANPLHRRLLNAFPDLKSLKHNKELEELRRSINALRHRSGKVIRRRNELAMEAYEDTLPEGEEKPFAFGLCYSKLFWVFMIGSVVGFVSETVFALAAPPHSFELRVSVVFGPFIVIYGVGAVLFTVVLYHMYNQRDMLIFIACMVLGSASEYGCSFIQQYLFGTVSWEYSGTLLNLSGRTNLMYSFFWGVLGLVWLKDIYPLLSRKIQSIPKKTGRTLTAVCSVLMAIDILISAGAVYRQSQRVNGVPAENFVQRFFDDCFPDEFLKVIYPHMEYVGRPEIEKVPPPD